jgi:RNA polymerase sigma-70 factor (ECF subfamily)
MRAGTGLGHWTARRPAGERRGRDERTGMAGLTGQAPMLDEGATLRVREVVDAVYRTESRRVLATLIRLLGDFDAAEEALHDAFAAAIEQWPRDGVPANPRGWLVSTGRFKAIDGMRRAARFDASLLKLGDQRESGTCDPGGPDDESVADDRLRLIFTCCHPALPPDAQVAMTLRQVCGLTTEEIARAFLTRPATVAQRIVRAKAKIRDARIPYEVPSPPDLAHRLDAVLRVVYLVFNEGYCASSGGSLTRHDLSGEAIRLGRLLIELLPEPEAVGLLALMLLQDSRRAARTSPTGDLILLEDQDRSLWNREQIAEGASLVERALSSRRIGAYTLQAAIASVHAVTPSAAATDWARLVGLYDLLMRVDPSPVVELNRAVAVAMRDGPLVGLTLIDAILERGDLVEYHLAHSARADLCRRLGRAEEARAAYELALRLTRQDPERRFLARRLAELPG